MNAYRFVLFAAPLAISVAASGIARGQATPSQAPQSADELARRYQKAHAEKDVAAIERLFFWGNATPETRTQVSGTIERDIANTIRAVSIKPAAANDPTTYTQRGVKYQMTLKPVSRLEIEFAPRTVNGTQFNGERTSYSVGVRDGGYYLVTAEPAP
jgi:hypothetical protein